MLEETVFQNVLGFFKESEEINLISITFEEIRPVVSLYIEPKAL